MTTRYEENLVLGTAHLDNEKTVSEPLFIRPFFELVTDETKIFSTAKKIVNLFAGNCNESLVTAEYLQQASNNTCEIIAVDRTVPSSDMNINILKKEVGERFHFVLSDALDYLQSLPTDSVDLITAFGAEYVLRRHSNPQASEIYWREVYRVLKMGGISISPGMSAPNKEAGFASIFRSVIQKIAK